MTLGALPAREDLLAEATALAARIDALESIVAIEDLHRTFVRAVADRQFDDLPGYFVDDAVIDMREHGPKAGRAEITAHFQGMRGAPLDGAGYLLSSPVVTVDGDTATGSWTWTRFHANGQVAGKTVRISGVWEEGRYACRYRREAGRWRFARMRFRVVKPDPDVSPYDTPEHEADR